MALKLIFMGTPSFAVPILKSIHKSEHKILEVYTQPPTKSGRGQKINYSDIYNCAEQLKLKVRFPKTLDTTEEINHIKTLNPNLVVVVAYGKILPIQLLNIDQILFINIHASLLPRWRGAAPIQRAIMNMDSETGISIMKIKPQLDSGPVMMQERIKISQETNYEDLSKKMSEMGSKLILESIKLIESGKVNFVEQKETEVTYARKIEKNESKINWKESAKKIIAKINAFYPNPGCWFKLSNARVKITKAIEVKNSGEAGTILDNKMTIACAKNAIQILELKKEGKKQMSIDEYLKGNKIKIGQKIN
jgi:methionyl-tRNA formyltransferase